METETCHKMRRSSIDSDSDRAPFFIMGCPRSGTTLVSRILNTHSELAVYHEIHYYPVFRPCLRLYGDLGQARNLRRLIQDLREWIRLQGVVPPELGEFEAHLVEPSFAGIFTTLLRLYARSRHKKRGGDKTPDHYQYLSEILDSFPESPVIYVMRDPRDTVLSLRQTFNATLWGAVRAWNSAYESYRRASSAVHLLRYEDLIRKPEPAIRAMCDSIGVTYEPEMLRFFEDIPERIRSREHLKKILKPLDDSSIGRFRQMPEPDIRKIEAACLTGMKDLGYELTFQTVGPEPFKKSRIRFLLERLRYYGLNRDRWQRGVFRWRLTCRLYLRHWLALRIRTLGRPN